MVKLASAREIRMYGARVARNKSEYINAGLYLAATILLMGGLAAQFSREPGSGLVVMLIGFGLIMVVNVHDLVAHLAGIDFWIPLMEFDPQLALVEFGVPLVQTLGSLLSFLAILFLLIQVEKGHSYYELEQHAMNMLVAGPALWLLGSVLNTCQIYERADAHIQILQASVYIPFLMASLLFLVAAVVNSHEQSESVRHGLELLGVIWIWLSMCGSVLLFIGGLANVVKVYKMQQIEGPRLEKLRGGAHEQLINVREGRVPLILEGQGRSVRQSELAEEAKSIDTAGSYKDVLVGHS